MELKLNSPRNGLIKSEGNSRICSFLLNESGYNSTVDQNGLSDVLQSASTDLNGRVHRHVLGAHVGSLEAGLVSFQVRTEAL